MFPSDNLNLTIDSIYLKLLEKLSNDGRTQDISRHFLTLSETDERVLYVYSLLKTYQLLPLILKEDKCEYTSVHYRNLGNMLYERKNLYMAWQYYNLALMYSPLDSPSYALAVSNRSAVLAGLKQYEACIADIEMVFSESCPLSVRDKLLKRKNMCLEALQEAQDQDFDGENEQIEDIFTMKGSKHEKYVAASSKLTVKHTPEMGRHVIAVEDIEVGEIIVQEDPYVTVLLRNQVLITCAHCFSRKFNLYPCPYCCMTMYCSKKCVIMAWDEYHSNECPFIASLIHNEFTKLELLALRTTIKARTDHKVWENVLNTVEKVDACTNTDDLGCQQTENGNMVYASENYESVHSLATNIEKRGISDIFQKAVSAAVLMHYLAMKNFIASDEPVLRKRIKKFTADTLMRHLMTAPTNMHCITANVEDNEGNYVDEYNIGSGAYPFLSLINHSCAPNVVRYTRLGTTQMTLFALRPIKKGMQIFDNYGAHHAVNTRYDRQTILRSQYKFTCVCEACTADWPLYFGLHSVPDLPAAITQKMFKHGDLYHTLQKADRKRVLKLFKPLCELATALEPYAPCKEAADCQEALKQCLAVLSGVLSEGFTNYVEWALPAPRGPGQPISSSFYVGAGALDILND